MNTEIQPQYKENISSYRTTYQSRFGPALLSTNDQSHLYNRSSNQIRSFSKSRRNNSYNPYTRSSYISKRSEDMIEDQPLPHIGVYDEMDEPVSRREIMNKEIGMNTLEKQNKELKSELHKLRKIQAGWFGKEKQKVIEKVKVEHHHYLDEKKVLQEKIKVLEIERDKLIEQNNVLKSQTPNTEFQKSNKQINLQSTNIVEQQNSKQTKEIEMLKNQLNEVKNENNRLKSQHKIDLQKLKSEVNHQQQIHTSKVEQNYASVINIKNTLENQMIEKNKQISDLKNKNMELSSKINQLQAEVNNYQTGIYNTNIKVESQNDSQQIIDRYKAKLEDKNIENQRLKNQISELKEKIHKVTLENQKLETRSNISIKDNDKQKLLFDLENLKNQNQFQEEEIKKLKEIISKAKDQPANRTVHVTEEYRTITNNNGQNNNSIQGSTYQRSGIQDYNNQSYFSNKQQKMSFV